MNRLEKGTPVSFAALDAQGTLVLRTGTVMAWLADKAVYAVSVPAYGVMEASPLQVKHAKDYLDGIETAFSPRGAAPVV